MSRGAKFKPSRVAVYILAACLISSLAWHAAGQQELICDGQTRTIAMATAPFPEQPPWTPWTGPQGISCNRPLEGTSRRCGAMEIDNCAGVQFSPVLQSSGTEPGIIPPNNPLQFSIDPGSPAYITYAEFRAGNIGTAGAKLSGVYGSASQLTRISNDYAWVRNGPTELADGTVVFDSCGDCNQGTGIQTLSITAEPGAGFRALELSQLFSDTRCEGSGVNNDGLMWDANMRYRCVVPTCDDVDLNTAGAQPFTGCIAPFIYRVDSAGVSPPSVANCCIQPTGGAATCGAVVPGQPFSCPFGYEYDSSRDNVTSPSVDACCVRATCGNIAPVTSPGVRITCPAGSEFNPASNDAFPPNTANCCVEATCSNVAPVTNPGQSFPCEIDAVPNRDAGNISPPSQDACCLRRTCGTPNPDDPTQAFQCATDTEFDPSTIGTSPPSQQACCRSGTCSQPNPITRPGVVFSCPEPSQYNPNAGQVSPPSTTNCCTQPADGAATCGAVFPGQQFSCPTGFEYDERRDDVTNPSVDACCVRATCGNVAPVTSPNTRFTCPAGSEFNPASNDAAPPSNTNCCVAATCSDVTPIANPGQPFSCDFGSIPNNNASDTNPPSQEACCVRRTCGTPYPNNPSQEFQCALNSELDPASNLTSPPSQQACCRSGTCSQPNPISQPNIPFSCPESTEYDPNLGQVSPPAASTCCRPLTCGNLEPVTNPGQVRFDCADGTTFNDDNANRGPPSNALCCQAWVPTCGDVDANIPGTQFDCTPFFQVFNTSFSGRSPPTAENCCSEATNIPQADVDVYVIKTVEPSVDAAGRLSTWEPVGSTFRFTLEVGLRGLGNPVAREVVLVDTLPAGLLLLNITEDPDRNACSFTTTSITCTWAQISATDRIVITLTVTGTRAGVLVNTARVTTVDTDTNPANNVDTSTVRTQGACCALDGTCRDTSPRQCQSPNIFDEDNTCATSRQCTNQTAPESFGACCINTNNIVTCVDNVPFVNCNGIWSGGRSCSTVQCSAPTGACCDVQSGRCFDGVTRDQCSNADSWVIGGRCGQNNVCVGGCCNRAAGSCTVTRVENCPPPNTWSLYSDCTLDYCPLSGGAGVGVCTPAWGTCSPTGPNPCCNGYSCQPAYAGYPLGPFVCAPAAATCEPTFCGGTRGSCCDGMGCYWDNKKGRGRCRTVKKNKCGKKGATCGLDWDCCIGHRCVAGQCQKVTKEKCKRNCKSYDCFNERKSDCNVLFAAAASDQKLM